MEKNFKKNEKSGKNNWLLMKRNDKFANAKSNITVESPHSILPKVKKSTLPKKPTRIKKISAFFVSPQLPQLVKTAPNGDNWIHEIKLDGYRTLCLIRDKKIQLLTRAGNDWTTKYKSIAREAKKFKVKDALIDGEIVWLEENGQSNFQKLQNALEEGESRSLVFYVFDLLFLNGANLQNRTLLERKEFLKKLMRFPKSSQIRYSDHWHTQGKNLYRASCKLGLEGIVSKDIDSPYVSGRNSYWQKTKCFLRQEFIICGYSNTAVPDRPFGSLLLGVYNSQQILKYVGRVGTGFTERTYAELQPLLKQFKNKSCPFSRFSDTRKDVHWLKPKIACEVEFKSWTSDGIIRHASFQGLRKDKSISEIHKESPGTQEPERFKITHPDRIVYKKTKTKKIEVIEYYRAIAPLMMPFVEDRPISLLRCQENTSSECFFQKHSDEKSLSHIISKPVHYQDKEDFAINIQSQSQLIEVIQSGAIEIHAWNARFSHITTPDQIVFDLDPESKKLWDKVVDTAKIIRKNLEKLELKSFLKVTGGKGLHIHVPLSPKQEWDEIKSFTKSLMEVLNQEAPQDYTVNLLKKQRHGKIFLDYLRNGYGATAVVPYSLRARVQPTVALPISWTELKKNLHPDQFTYPSVLKLIEKREDPWIDYWDHVQTIKILEK